jgi:hypothetical protein
MLSHLASNLRDKLKHTKGLRWLALGAGVAAIAWTCPAAVTTRAEQFTSTIKARSLAVSQPGPPERAALYVQESLNDTAHKASIATDAATTYLQSTFTGVWGAITGFEVEHCTRLRPPTSCDVS